MSTEPTTQPVDIELLDQIVAGETNIEDMKKQVKDLLDMIQLQSYIVYGLKVQMELKR